jgi:hypothetical protein
MIRMAMSTSTGKRKVGSKAPARADQLRPLNLPQPAEVELDDAGLPAMVASSVCPSSRPPVRPENDEEHSEATDRSPTRKAVESIIEVWHLDDEWWREPISRRCVEVILEGGKHVVLYEDLTTGAWFMQRP